MKRLVILSVTMIVTLSGCMKGQISSVTASPNNNTAEASVSSVPSTAESSSSTTENKEKTEMMKIQIGDQILTASFAGNSSADALKAMISKGPVTIQMDDYAGMEKVGSLGTSLPTNDEQITTEAGDIILYQGDKLVIYYATNSWDFTRIGKINDTASSDLRKILGSGSVTVTLSLDEKE